MLLATAVEFVSKDTTSKRDDEEDAALDRVICKNHSRCHVGPPLVPEVCTRSDAAIELMTRAPLNSLRNMIKFWSKLIYQIVIVALLVLVSSPVS